MRAAASAAAAAASAEPSAEFTALRGQTVVNIVTGQTQQLTELLPAGGRRCIRAFLTQFGDFDSVELVQVRATAMQKWRIVRLGSALRDREWLLNEGQIQKPSVQG